MIKVAMHPLSPSGVGPRVGFITLTDTPDGLMLVPELSGVDRFGVQPGVRGFHVHEFGKLEPAVKDGELIAGGAAGGHYDPGATGSHQGPWGNGHLGDLPALRVGEDGSISGAVVAPRLKTSDVLGRALIIHSGGDNYSDKPAQGGGHHRLLGGIITNDCPYCKPKDSTMNTLITIGLGMAGIGVLAGLLGASGGDARGSRATSSCPRATRDLELNTRNRQLAIDKYDYGPLNPQEPSTSFWRKIASRWNNPPSAKNIEEAKSARCGNCVAFDISPRMEACMPGPVTNAGKLGFCWMHDFKCASLRTCATWAGGGPITSDAVSLDWQRRKGG